MVYDTSTTEIVSIVGHTGHYVATGGIFAREIGRTVSSLTVFCVYYLKQLVVNKPIGSVSLNVLATEIE